jgi:hypothetical protein
LLRDFHWKRRVYRRLITENEWSSWEKYAHGDRYKREKYGATKVDGKGVDKGNGKGTGKCNYCKGLFIKQLPAYIRQVL